MHEITNSKSFGFILTCFIALSFGWIFRTLNSPAPYLLGSVFGVWAVGAIFKPVTELLNVPRWSHVTVILGLGVLIGSMFESTTLQLLVNWLPTVAMMLAITAIATSAGFLFLTRFRNYPRLLAILCSLPGGQAEIILLSREWVEKDYVVAICHLCRVTVVLCVIPLMLWLLQGEQAVTHSNRVLQTMPGIFDLPLAILIQFLGTAALGYGLGRVVRLPMPHLLGPLIFSVALHVSGIIDVPRVQEFVIAVQVIIGGAIGARLAKVNIRKLLDYVCDALVNSVILIGIFVLALSLIAQFSGFLYIDMLLAFIPGGIYEVTLLSLLFGLDVAFVTFHHAIRVILIFFVLPVLVRRFSD